jgi:NADH-quinone oxidoreductase subunit E
MTGEAAQKTTLPKELTDFVEIWREKPGNLIMILHKMQQIYGYIPRAEALELARYMDIPLAKIYGVITFYHFFKLKKPGKNKIQVCMGTACYLKGGQDLINEIENLIGIGVNQTTEDDEFSMESVRCVGCCGLAPVVMINEEVYGKLKNADLPEIIAKHRGE